MTLLRYNKTYKQLRVYVFAFFFPLIQQDICLQSRQQQKKICRNITALADTFFMYVQFSVF